MLRAIKLTNFRAIAESGTLPLRPLTVILGPNSSGKSSILRAISLARQTVAARDESVPLVLSGPYTDLGSYHDVIYRHSLKRTLGLSYTFDAVEDFARDFRRPRSAPRAARSESVTISSEFGYFARPARVYLKSTVIDIHPNDLHLRLEVSGTRATAIVQSGDLEARARVQPSKFYGLSTRAATSKWIGTSPVPDADWPWLIAAHAFQNTMSNVLHLGPLRDAPRRTYVVSGEAPLDVGAAGESAIPALFAASRKQTTRAAFSAVNDWLGELGMARKLRFKRISPTQYVVEVEDSRTGVITSLPDMGFGVSQILPALVQLQLMDRHGTLMMEQPEIHLHPSLQTALADVLIASTVKGTRQVIVETHSELLLARIQRRVADQSLSRSDVAVLYLEMSSEGTQAKELALDEFGNFVDQLPEGFFSEEYIERYEQSKAIATRQRHAS